MSKEEIKACLKLLSAEVNSITNSQRIISSITPQIAQIVVSKSRGVQEYTPYSNCDYILDFIGEIETIRSADQPLLLDNRNLMTPAVF